jgi:hypothetical protein
MMDFQYLRTENSQQHSRKLMKRGRLLKESGQNRHLGFSLLLLLLLM